VENELLKNKLRGLHFAMDHMSDVVKKIRHNRDKIDLSACYGSLAADNLIIGFFRYFVEGNVDDFKQHLYTACQLKLAEFAINSHQRFEIGYEILFALFSDSPAMIRAVANFESKEFVDSCENPIRPQFRVHMWQLALRGEYVALEDKIRRLAKNGRKPERTLASEGSDFFSLLIKNSKPDLEARIKEDANAQNADAITEGYISFPAALEAKLCWYRGIQVGVDHPLVPMELMPILPLEHYAEVYDFLSPNYVPSSRGLIGRLSDFLKI